MTEYVPESIEIARLFGFKFYNTGTPCKRGHIANRLARSRNCVECHAIWYRETYDSRRPALLERVKKWAAENPERSRQIKRDWIENNPGKVETSRVVRNVKRNDYRKSARHTDPDLMVREALSGMVKRICKLTGRKKKLKTMESVGYNVADLKAWIEWQFKPGMTWANHGEWHIDHVKPIAMFIREGVIDPAIINALENLQPLWAAENLAKRDRYVG